MDTNVKMIFDEFWHPIWYNSWCKFIYSFFYYLITIVQWHFLCLYMYSIYIIHMYLWMICFTVKIIRSCIFIYKIDLHEMGMFLMWRTNVFRIFYPASLISVSPSRFCVFLSYANEWNPLCKRHEDKRKFVTKIHVTGFERNGEDLFQGRKRVVDEKKIK